MKKQYGFTLVEILVYLGLFAILMAGMLATAFSMLESSDRDQTRVLMQGDGDFMVAKINWALTGVKDINSPSGSILEVNKWITPGVATTVDFRLSGTDMVIRRGGGAPIILNNSNIQVENLNFIREYGGTNQEYVKASFTIRARALNGMLVTQEFSTIKYIRK
jgi:hypothetical protein